MSKYIKNVNWPWVEILDSFSNEDTNENTVVINMNDVSLLWESPYWKYKGGVKLKNGEWFEHITKEGLVELKELLMNHKDNKPTVDCSLHTIDIDADKLHEEQTMYEWLNEEGQV